MDGIPNWKCLFPIKLTGIAFSIILGNSFYNGSKKMIVFQSMQKSIKYISIVAIIMAIAFLLRVLILGILAFDIMPFIL